MVIFPQQYCFLNPQIIYHIPQYLHIVCEISLDVPDVTIDGICMGKKKQIKNGRRNYPNGWGNAEPDIPVHDWPNAGSMPVDARPRQTSPSGGLLCLRPSSLNAVFAQQICLRTPLIGGHDRHQLAAYLVRVPHQVAPCRLLSWRVVGVGDCPANKKQSPNAGLMLCQRRRRWPSIKPALGHCHVFSCWLLFFSEGLHVQDNVPGHGTHSALHVVTRAGGWVTSTCPSD